MPSFSSVYEALSHRNDLRLKELGSRLRLARQRRQWTQSVLATKSGVSAGTIKKIEAGNPRVPLGFWLQLMDVFALAHELESLALPEHDSVGAAMEVPTQRQRVRSKTEPVNFDLEDD